MSMNDTVIPNRIDVTSTDDVTIDVSATDKIRIKPEFENNNITRPIAKNQIEIIELQANASVTPFDHDSLLSDTFSDADGYNDTVDTGNTTAGFSTDKYTTTTEAKIFSEEIDDRENPNYTSGGQATWFALDFTPASNVTVKKVSLKFGTKEGSGCDVTAHIYSDDGADSPNVSLKEIETIGKASINASAWNDFEDVDGVALTQGTKYWLVFIPSDGGGVNRFNLRQRNGAGIGHDYSVDGGSNWGSEANTTNFRVYSNATGDVLVQCDLATITGSVTDVELVCNCPDRETGDDVTFDVVDGSANTDTGIALNTKFTLVNLTGNPEIIKINLEPKATTPTGGYPSVKTYALKVWKS